MFKRLFKVFERPPNRMRYDDNGDVYYYFGVLEATVILCPVCLGDDTIVLRHGEPTMCKCCGVELAQTGARLEIGDPYLGSQIWGKPHITIWHVYTYEDGYAIYMNEVARNCSLIRDPALRERYRRFHCRLADLTVAKREAANRRYGPVRRPSRYLAGPGKTPPDTDLADWYFTMRSLVGCANWTLTKSGVEPATVERITAHLAEWRAGWGAAAKQ